LKTNVNRNKLAVRDTARAVPDGLLILDEPECMNLSGNVDMSFAAYPYNDDRITGRPTAGGDVRVRMVMRMFGRKRVGRAVFWIIPAVMTVWMTYQLYSLFESRQVRQDAARMLFEASSFQIELMSRFLSEAVNARVSSQLDSLKNAVYAAAYVHDRFASVFPPGQIDDLASLKMLLQYLMHLQIGGDRPLKEEEKSLLQQMEPMYKQLAEAYAGMMDEKGRLIRYGRSLVKDLDDKLLAILGKHV